MPLALRSTETHYSDDADAVPASPFDIPWHRQGNCFGRGYDNFFHDEKLGAVAAANRAKEVCNSGCPVKRQCLASALQHRDDFGIWGGTAPPARRKMLKRIDAGESTIDQEVRHACP